MDKFFEIPGATRASRVFLAYFELAAMVSAAIFAEVAPQFLLLCGISFSLTAVACNKLQEFRKFCPFLGFGRFGTAPRKVA